MAPTYDREFIICQCSLAKSIFLTNNKGAEKPGVGGVPPLSQLARHSENKEIPNQPIFFYTRFVFSWLITLIYS